MLAMCPTSDVATLTAPRKWRFALVVFLVRMWRLNAWPRLTVPPGRTRKRFLAELLVFIFGMLMLSLYVLVRCRQPLPSCKPRDTC